MPSAIRVFNVLIASPGDARAGRDEVERALHEWNDHRSDREKVILRPLRWEIASVPISGRGDAQTVINAQLVDEADAVIGIFYHRLGTATARDLSGSVEEINRAITAGKPVHLYFANKSIPYTADLEQVGALRVFRQKMESTGLVAEFSTEQDLAGRVKNAIEYDLKWAASSQSFNDSTPESGWTPSKTDGQLQVKYWEADYTRGPDGKVKQLNREHFSIRNIGNEPIEIVMCYLHEITSHHEPAVLELRGPRLIGLSEFGRFESSYEEDFPIGSHDLQVNYKISGKLGIFYVEFAVEVLHS